MNYAEYFALRKHMHSDYSSYFERHHCSSESAEFNASIIIEKYQG